MTSLIHVFYYYKTVSRKGVGPVGKIQNTEALKK